MTKGSLKNIFKLTAGTGLALSPGFAFAAGGLALGSLTFAAPAALLATASLVPIWWLMRSIPPKPTSVFFPAMNILFDIKSNDQTTLTMPLWQRILRSSVLGLAIMAAAQPQVTPNVPLTGNGPVMLVVDNGWASAQNWSTRAAEMKNIIDRIEREDRKVIILQTAQPDDNAPIAPTAPMNPADARRMVLDMEPQPWPVDRKAALQSLQKAEANKPDTVIWISNGMDSPETKPFIEKLQGYGKMTVLQDHANVTPHLLSIAHDQGVKGLTMAVRRIDGTKPQTLSLIAGDEGGQPLAQAHVIFKTGELEAKAELEMPSDIRNQVARVSIDGDSSAGSVFMLDERWRRRPVGLVGLNGEGQFQSLLNEASYITKALEPYVDMRQGSVDDLLKNNLAVMIATDNVVLNDDGKRRINEWVRNGGTLLRFAGPNMAVQQGVQTERDLLPVPLSKGVRAVTGIAPGTRATMAPFEKSSPFAGIKPSTTVNVDRAIVAQPGADNNENVWARLENGTPIVTARRQGSGWIVLVHTTASPEWSDLALSGTFIDMMRAVVTHSQGIGAEMNNQAFSLPPVKMLDGRGRFISPVTTVEPITSDIIQSHNMGPKTPPGIYGNESLRYAYNLSSVVTEMKPLPSMPDGVGQATYDLGKGTGQLAGWFMLAALWFLLAERVVLLSQRGHLPGFKRQQDDPVPETV